MLTYFNDLFFTLIIKTVKINVIGIVIRKSIFCPDGLPLVA